MVFSLHVLSADVLRAFLGTSCMFARLFAVELKEE